MNLLRSQESLAIDQTSQQITNLSTNLTELMNDYQHLLFQTEEEKKRALNIPQDLPNIKSLATIRYDGSDEGRKSIGQAS